MSFPPKHRTLRQQLWNVMHFGKGKLGRNFTYGLILLILASLSLLPLELFDLNNRQAEQVLRNVEMAITVIFTIEYALRIYAAPNRPKYIFSFLGFIDLISIAPFYMGFFGGGQSLRALRLFRLFRLLKLSRMEASAVMGKDTAKELDLLPGERVDYVVSRHPLQIICNLLVCLMCSSIAVLILFFIPINPITIAISASIFFFTVIYFYKVLLDFNFDVIYVTTHRLIFQNWHLLGRNTNQISYRSITNVKPYYSGMLGYLLKFGSIEIETPSVAAGKINYDLARKHEKAAQAIMEKCFSDAHGQPIHHTNQSPAPAQQAPSQPPVEQTQPQQQVHSPQPPMQQQPPVAQVPVQQQPHVAPPPPPPQEQPTPLPQQSPHYPQQHAQYAPPASAPHPPHPQSPHHGHVQHNG